MSILLALFCFRVLAQLFQRYIEVPFLPPFDAWQSGTVPYSVLLASQVLIIVFYGWILRCLVLDKMQPSRRQGRIFLIVGLVYFLVMVARLLIGVTGLSEHHWFRSYLPTLFHFVLSGYLIVVGNFHLQATARRP
ncbi:MAG: hypothetical protein HY274_09260 [Gammaproteobacteria bacterium]|nr:hypothetical protein [Gammaproteobacteria bacterium]